MVLGLGLSKRNGTSKAASLVGTRCIERFHERIAQIFRIFFNSRGVWWEFGGVAVAGAARVESRLVTKFSVLCRSTLYVSCNKTGLELLQQLLRL